MKVNDIMKAQQMCFLQEGCDYCKECPLFECEAQNCQVKLAQLTIDKFKELVELLDDKVNHHYYDTLEVLQEENTHLKERIEQVIEILRRDH